MNDDGLQEEGLVETALDEGGAIGETGEDRQDADYENEIQDDPEPLIESKVREISEGGGAWMDLWGVKDGHVMKIHIWQNAENVSDALFQLLSAMKDAEQWKLKPYEPILPLPGQTTQAPAGQPAQKAPGQAPAAPGATKPQPPAQAQAQPATAGGVLNSVKITAAPRPDGKITVQFWGAGQEICRPDDGWNCRSGCR